MVSDIHTIDDTAIIAKVTKRKAMLILHTFTHIILKTFTEVTCVLTVVMHWSHSDVLYMKLHLKKVKQS